METSGKKMTGKKEWCDIYDGLDEGELRIAEIRNQLE